MNVTNGKKCASDERIRRYHQLLNRIVTTNNTRLSDETVLAILNADRGTWTEHASVEELFVSLGI